MGTALRKLNAGIAEENGPFVKFKGRLTGNTISALNDYYGMPSGTTKITLMGWYKL